MRASKKQRPKVSALTVEQRRVRVLALAGATDELVELLARELLHGRSPASMGDHLIGPALAAVGESWVASELSPADEHLGTHTMIDALARLRPLVESRTQERWRAARSARPSAIVAAVTDAHDVALRLVGLVLIDAGFTVVALGDNVPGSALADMIAERRPALVALGAALYGRSRMIRRELPVVVAAATKVGAVVRVGGEGFGGLALPPDVERCVTLADLAGTIPSISS